MAWQAPRFYNKTSQDLTHLDGACSGGQPLADLSNAMWSAGFCPQCAPGWRLLKTPSAADPCLVDISIEVGGVVTSLRAGGRLTDAYYAALDPEVDAAIKAAWDRFAKAVDEFVDRPVYTVPGDWTFHQAECPHLACRPDVREHLWRWADELDDYDECGCSACALCCPLLQLPGGHAGLRWSPIR